MTAVNQRYQLFDRTIYKIIAFTWSPDEKQYGKEHIQSRMDDFIAKCAYYALIPEYREKETNEGLHYHGILFVYDWRRLKSRQYTAFKSYVIKPRYEYTFRSDRYYKNPITNIDQGHIQGWINYCCKDKGEQIGNAPDLLETFCNKSIINVTSGCRSEEPGSA